MAAPELRNDENLGQRCIYLGQLARALCGVGKYQEAHSILLEAERIALELENNEYRSRTYELLALVASATGESAQALSYLDKARTAHERPRYRKNTGGHRSAHEGGAGTGGRQGRR
jgi:tetratricopeptide (TPR) repeat protein